MALNDIFAAFRWWAILMLIGAAATPITLYLFRRLPDRGYAFVKLVGLLIVSYLFWLLGSLGFLGNNLGGILFAFVLLVGLSIWATTRLKAKDYETNLRSWLRLNRSQIILTELLFAILFVAWVWVRAQNPAITATEKPMEFAFLNAIGRSPAFPPVDPWLSGFAISYYYFGYVMTSIIARLAAVPEPIAFNLAIAWLVAGVGTAAFGLVYNLVMGINHRDTEDAERDSQVENISPASNRRAALLLGLVAAVALPIAGNLETGLELPHASGVGSDQFWQWLDVRDLNGPAEIAETPRYETSAWWWWRSSRVIHEYHLSGRAEAGLEPIAEFPGFSFILGDLHPHVLALPFAFLSLAVAYLWYLEGLKINDLGLKNGEQPSSFFSQISFDMALWLFTALLLGGLAFLNTWDVLIHLFVVVGAFILGRWQAIGWEDKLVWQAIRVALGLIIALFLLYLPFFLGFRSQAGAPYLLPMLMRPTRLAHYLIIFGMPMISVTILVLMLAVRQRFQYWRVGVTTAVSLLLGLLLLMLLLGWIVAASAEGAGRVLALADELGLALSNRPESGLALGWGLSAVFTILPAILNARIAYPALTLFLLVILALVVMIWTHLSRTETRKLGDEKSAPAPTSTPLSASLRLRPPSPLPFILLLIATGILLTLGPEFVHLRDNFGQRLNTIFKFYYQAWVMFGVAALFALGYLWQTAKLAGHIATIGYGLALAVASLFPYFAVNSRAIEYRGPVTADIRQPATLNGLAQVERFNPDEYAAIQWLRQNVIGTPTIVEAVGGQYSNYGRISASTGLPTILGWAGHEYQWRGPDTPEPARREPAVEDIYSTPNWGNTALLLNLYDVEYIVVGGLELNTYGPQSAEKFKEMDVAYRNNNITIYHWQPEE